MNPHVTAAEPAPDSLMTRSNGDPGAGARALDPVAAQTTLVSAIMSRRQACVDAATSVEGVTAVMLEYEVDGVPVIDDEKRLVGMVFAADLLREVQDHADGIDEQVPLRTTGPGGVRAWLGRGFHRTCLARTTAGEIMRADPTAISPDASVADAALWMARGRVTALPIVNSGREVVGVVTTLDVMRWLVVAPHILPSGAAEPACAGCATILARLCGDNSAAQQTWFRPASHLGLCSEHRVL